MHAKLAVADLDSLSDLDSLLDLDLLKDLDSLEDLDGGNWGTRLRRQRAKSWRARARG